MSSTHPGQPTTWSAAAARFAEEHKRLRKFIKVRDGKVRITDRGAARRFFLWAAAVGLADRDRAAQAAELLRRRRRRG
jgi:hypothetical protein